MWKVIFRSIEGYPVNGADGELYGPDFNPDWTEGMGYANVTQNPTYATEAATITQDPPYQGIFEGVVSEGVKDKLISGNYDGILQVFDYREEGWRP